MVLLYAPGVTPESPLAVGPVWTSSQHTLEAWDGTEWDLSFGLSGVKLLAGTRGMDDPPIIRYSSKAPVVAGSLYRGSSFDERDVLWRLKTFSSGGSDAWLTHLARFWNTMDPEQTNRWVVTQPSGERRALTVRYVGLGDDTLTDDPALVGRRTFEINQVAENPFWLGEPITRTFDNKASQNFFGGDSGGGFGPPYYLSSGTLVSSATIKNPGHVSVWPTVTLTGPSTTATILGVTFPMTLSSGQWVTINTDPTDQVALNQAGVDVTGQLVNFANFAEIPRGDAVDLPISMTGTGSVTISITPAYRRAVG